MVDSSGGHTRGRVLRPGDAVSVASRGQILATLDASGELDGMPVMPCMLRLCGTQQVVYKRADKSCDTINGSGGLRLHNTVHLADSRCDGSDHGGCEAGCLIFWKEAWLRPADGASKADAPELESASPENDLTSRATSADASAVLQTQYSARSGEPRYRCQATQLLAASAPLPWWNPGQYWRDWRYNDVRAGQLIRAAGFFLFKQSLRIGGYNLQVRLFNRWQALRGRPPFPFASGRCERTPVASLGLQPGEYVRIKPYNDILATLDRRNRNRGLFFDAEMVKHCGGVFRVQKRVTRIIEEATGKMLNFRTPCIILENVFCTSQVSAMRLFCPRSIHHYWREIWLERIDAPGH